MHTSRALPLEACRRGTEAMQTTVSKTLGMKCMAKACKACEQYGAPGDLIPMQAVNADDRPIRVIDTCRACYNHEQ